MHTPVLEWVVKGDDGSGGGRQARVAVGVEEDLVVCQGCAEHLDGVVDSWGQKNER